MATGESNQTNSELTSLIRRQREEGFDRSDPTTANTENARWLALFLSPKSLAATAVIFVATTLALATISSSVQPPALFPTDFVWGSATSSYQVEGAVNEGRRGPTIWDTFVHTPGHILDNSTGDVACDHYHRFREDVALMKSLNLKAYRFSIAWSRILPNGAGEVNTDGIRFYSDLIDTLLEYGIEPWVTMFHWDLPQALEDDFGSWLDPKIVDAFGAYARILFESFGDRVKHWITLNEPWTVAVNGYSTGIHAPGHNSVTEPYIVAHHLLLAHARTVAIYRGEYVTQQQGIIGIANCGDFRYPKTTSIEDQTAAERAMLFQFGWFVDPIFFGKYPDAMKERLGDRLMDFTDEEKSQLIGSVDFLGLNYYSAFFASEPAQEPTWGGYWADIFVDFSSDSAWNKNDMGWNVVPDGLYRMLKWVERRYNGTSLYITENGSAEREPNLELAERDDDRQAFFQGHLRAAAEAIAEGVDLKGFFAWSFMDNFEWQFGYTKRFGISHVDYQTLKRTPKQSAEWYRDTIGVNGENLRDIHLPSSPRLEAARKLRAKRALPETVLIGYGTGVQFVRKAVEDGVNVVIWSFLDFFCAIDNCRTSCSLIEKACKKTIRTRTSLNMTAIRELVVELEDSGYGHVVHLVSVGGWGAPHLDPDLSAADWYACFVEQVGDLFHGIDWDLEGTDSLEATTNEFTMECLDKMGEISRLAKQDGYFVSMAPPQSYLDVWGTSKFSRFVNLTDPDRRWHSEFNYWGANVYAYLLLKFDKWIDLISVQFYESYSRAAQAVVGGTLPADYLCNYVNNLVDNDEEFYVRFSDDSNLNIPDTFVSLPVSKLVLGLANGWAANSDEKTVFVPGSEARRAWSALQGRRPRGFMFWVIDLEGTNDVFLARELSSILHVSEDYQSA